MGTKVTKAELELQLARAQRELADFKEATRDLITSAIESTEICRSGGEQALRDLGLPVPKRKYSGSVHVVIRLDELEASEDRWGDIDSDAIDALTYYIEKAVNNGLANCSVPDEFGTRCAAYVDEVIDLDLEAD